MNRRKRPLTQLLAVRNMLVSLGPLVLLLSTLAGPTLGDVPNYKDIILGRDDAAVVYHAAIPGLQPLRPAPDEAGKTTATVTGGGQGWNVEGNTKRFRQYTTPVEGGTLAEVGIRSVAQDGKTVFSGSVRNVTEDDRTSEGKLEYLPDGADFSWESNRARFFRHFGPDDGRFERRELEAAFATPIGSEVDFDLGVDYVAMEGADTEGTVGWQAVTTRAGAYWTHGDVELEGIYAHERFQQDGPEFGGSEDSFAVLLAPARNHRYMFEGSAWWRSDDFEGLSPALNKWTDRGGALSLTADVLDGLLFYGRLYTQHISNSVTQNSFARNRKLASGALTWSRWDWLTLEAGGEFFETDYVSRFQDITDEPRTAVFWTKVRARPCDDLKVSASYVNRDVDAVPPSTLTDRTTALPVIWDQVKRLQANATYSIGDRAAVSYDFAEDKWRVAPQNANTRLTTNTGTAWWSPSGDWTFYANYINMDWAASGPGAPGVRPGDFATDIDVVSAGASYRLSQKSVANVNYTHVSGFGAVGTDEDVWDASYSHDLTDKTHVTVRYRFDQFDEDSASPSKDYRVHLFGVELGHDF